MPEPPNIFPVAPSRRPWWSRPRPWIGLAVAAVWATTMSLVWRNQAERSGATLREIGIPSEIILSTWQDVDQWTAIERGDEWLGGGHVSIQIERPSNSDRQPAGAPELPGFRLFSRVRLRLPVFGWSLPADLQMRVEMNNAFEVESIVSALMLAGQKANMEAFVENNSLYYRLRTGGIADEESETSETVAVQDAPTTGTRVAPAGNSPPGLGPGMTLPVLDICGRSPLKGPIMLSDALMPILSRNEKFRTGAEWTTRVANPLFGQLDQTVYVHVDRLETITREGKPIKAWRTTEKLGQMTTTAWYDEQGQSLRREMANGLIITTSSGKSVVAQEPLLRRDMPMAKAPDREWIRSHLDPSLEGRPLESLLPGLPGI